MSTRHGDVPLGSIHPPYNWVYANAAARATATGFVSADVNKVALDQDTGLEWVVTIVGAGLATWAQLNVVKSFKTSAAVTFNGGQSPKFSISSNKPVVNISQTDGNLLAGLNYLVPDVLPGTLQQICPDFAYFQRNPRLLTRNLTMTEIDDPPDITFRRFGPVLGYPYGGGFGKTGVIASSSTITLNATAGQEKALNNILTGQVIIGDGVTSTIQDSTTVSTISNPPIITACSFASAGTAVTFGAAVSVAPLAGAPVTGSNIQAGTTVLASPAPTTSGFSISAPASGTGSGTTLTIGNTVVLGLNHTISALDNAILYTIATNTTLTAVGPGGTVGQVRSTPAVAPYLGTVTTPGAFCPQQSAAIGFQVDELPRNLTGVDGDNAIGTQIQIQTCKIGRQISDRTAAFTSGGNTQIGFGAVNTGDTGDLLQIRGDAGRNETHTLTVTGSPTGTFKLSFFGDPPASGYATASVTSSLTVTSASLASDIQAALAALSPTVVSSVTGGPFPAAITVTYTGNNATHHYKALQVDNSSISGGTVKSVEGQIGMPTTALNTLVDVRGEVVGRAGSYFRIRDSAGSNVFKIDGNGVPTIGAGDERTLYRPAAALADTVPRWTMTSNTVALSTAGTLFFVPIFLYAGTVINNITFLSGSSPASGTISNQWFSLYDKSRNLLAVTADDTSTAWSTNATKTLHLRAGGNPVSYTTLTTDIFLLGCLVNATGMPNLSGSPTVQAAAALSPTYVGASTGSLTDPSTAPNPAAGVSSRAGTPYAYVS